MNFRNGVAPYDQTTFWQGMTPLMLAVKNNQLEMIKHIVVSEKANTEITNRSGKTALELAEKSIKDPNTLETVTKLLKK